MPQFPQRDLTNQYISTSYQDVVQRYLSASVDYLLDGLGYVILGIPTASVGNLILTQDQTASWAYNAVSASWAPGGTGNSISSSWASASFVATSASYASASTLSLIADVALLADTASVAYQSDSSSFSVYALSSGTSISSSWASASLTTTSASFATHALSASWAPDQTVSVNSASWASASISASYLNPGANIYLSQSYIFSETGSTQPPFTPATMWWEDRKSVV